MRSQIDLGHRSLRLLTTAYIRTVNEKVLSRLTSSFYECVTDCLHDERSLILWYVLYNIEHCDYTRFLLSSLGVLFEVHVK